MSVTTYQYAWLKNTSFVYDPPNLGVGNSTTHSVIVSGAELGDPVLVTAPYSISQLLLSGYVTSSGNVEILLFNIGSGPIDLPSGTWKITILK